MDLKYQFNTLEKTDDNISKTLENFRLSLLYRSRLLFARNYNINSRRLNSINIPEYFTILNQLYDNEIVETTKAELGSLDHIIYDDIISYNFNDFQITNL